MENNIDITNGLINFRKLLIKNRPEIKLYEKTRELYEDVLDSLENYLIKVIANKSTEMTKCLEKENFNYLIDFDSRDEDNKSILLEMFIYKVSLNFKSITEEYIEKNKFRNVEKIKMLDAMNNSVVGLFKVINIDFDNCYVTYEDIFTHKTYKIIDITFSTIYKNLYKEKDLYVYNRLISYEGITLGSGMHIKINLDDNKFKNFLKKHNYNKYSDLYRCLYLYYL